MSSFKDRLTRLLRLRATDARTPVAQGMPPPALSSSVVTHEPLDDSALKGIRGRAARLQAVFDRPPALPSTDGQEPEPYTGWDDLVSDLFRAFHTLNEPRVLPGEDVLPSRQRHRQVMQRILDTPEMVKTRAHTRLDPAAAAMATMQAASTLAQTLGESESRDLECSQRLSHLERQAGEALAELDQLINDGPDKNAQSSEQADALRQQIDGALEEIEQLAESQQRDAAAQRALGQLAQQAMQEAEKASQIISLLPGNGGPSEQQLDVDRALALAEKIHDSPVLQRILLVAGRIERDMRGDRARKITGARGQIVGITLTGDPARALPRELALLRHPVLRRETYRRIAEGRLFAYRTLGKAQAARGPVGAIRDGSESMRGQRYEWAGAVCLAVVIGAHREHRDAFVVEYGSTGHLKTWEFPHRRARPEDLIEMAGHFFNSGTDISQGVVAALHITRTRRPFSTADLILISDGEDRWAGHDQAVHDELVADGVRIQGIAVAHFPNAYLRRMCDGRVVRVDTLDAPSEPLRAVLQNIT